MLIRRWSGSRSRPPAVPVVDLLIAVAVAVPVVLDAWWNIEGTRQADALTFSLAAVSIAALTVRRRWPVPVAIVCGAAATAWYALGHQGEVLNLPTMVALYTVADLGDRRRSLLVGVVAALWWGLVAIVVDPPAGAQRSEPILDVMWPVVALLLGEVVRSRRELVAEHVARATAAEADREREARLRVEEERLRIARELHDIVAHTVSAMNVQAGLAIDALDTKPEIARQAMVQVRASGRSAIQELHAVLSVLRADEHTPAPGVGDLDDLVSRTSGTGLEVTADVDVGDVDLPAVVELAAYRIVQEALANAIRHAGAARAAVSVTCSNGTVEIEVTDDGRGPGEGALLDPSSGGFGLVGMRERADAVGGRVEFGARSGGGFRVWASLPARSPS